MASLAQRALEHARTCPEAPSDLREAAERERLAKMRARSVKARRSLARRKGEAKERGAAKAARSDMRAAAMEREGGRCALCGERDDGLGGPLHLHHVAGRHREAFGTVVMLCRVCHRCIHDGVPASLAALGSYCINHDMPEAARAVSRRLGRIGDSRSARTRGEG